MATKMPSLILLMMLCHYICNASDRPATIRSARLTDAHYRSILSVLKLLGNSIPAIHSASLARSTDEDPDRSADVILLTILQTLQQKLKVPRTFLKELAGHLGDDQDVIRDDPLRVFFMLRSRIGPFLEQHQLDDRSLKAYNTACVVCKRKIVFDERWHSVVLKYNSSDGKTLGQYLMDIQRVQSHCAKCYGHKAQRKVRAQSTKEKNVSAQCMPLTPKQIFIEIAEPQGKKPGSTAGPPAIPFVVDVHLKRYILNGVLADKAGDDGGEHRAFLFRSKPTPNPGACSSRVNTTTCNSDKGGGGGDCYDENDHMAIDFGCNLGGNWPILAIYSEPVHDGPPSPAEAPPAKQPTSRKLKDHARPSHSRIRRHLSQQEITSSEQLAAGTPPASPNKSASLNKSISSDNLALKHPPRHPAVKRASLMVPKIRIEAIAKSSIYPSTFRRQASEPDSLTPAAAITATTTNRIAAAGGRGSLRVKRSEAVQQHRSHGRSIVKSPTVADGLDTSLLKAVPFGRRNKNSVQRAPKPTAVGSALVDLGRINVFYGGNWLVADLSEMPADLGDAAAAAARRRLDDIVYSNVRLLHERAADRAVPDGPRLRVRLLVEGEEFDIGAAKVIDLYVQIARFGLSSSRWFLIAADTTAAAAADARKQTRTTPLVVTKDVKSWKSYRTVPYCELTAGLGLAAMRALYRKVNSLGHQLSLLPLRQD